MEEVGEDFASQIHQLNTADRARLVLALQKLNRMGWTLDEAVDFIEQHGKNPPAISLDELFRRFLIEKENKECRPRHMDNLRSQTSE